MEVLAVITTVYTLAQSINTWVEERAEKEVVIRQISGTVAQIQHILLPLQEAGSAIEIQAQTVGAVKSVGGVLKRTQEHLLVWEYRRSRRIFATLSPSSVIKQLKEDERQLSQQLILLLASIAVVGFVNKQRKRLSSLIPAPAVVRSKPPSRQSLILDSISNREVKEFWSGYVGAEVHFS
jgi:hypothetical protein